ncbi:hypothetical protein NDA11_007310 [Ustilago hordei]|uniref:Uncharacterized protein n=1 Tax=Ustilago hordei TaxID=120017 RepID=I2FV18_USTHO|nr:uncharacterized protein UHO2_06545 [Ustilago hordei]KAJ1040664.1 hypothetical protein NDA10_004304 [Ustilago hordei]KAJ1571684.1 hypothetical protein NDA11_007310 [Ustilago hordei]KAJ1576513.1 hypothetical protein NDA12_006576 [Ustilago hordei]KAJ1577934.1 hypothetical protein NDA15_007407 [Ustilago hordei]KAJ1598830.1 hypothetical protein NDA14_002945 [Ustilago hordei]
MTRRATKRVKKEQMLKPDDIDSGSDASTNEDKSQSYEKAVNLPAHQTKHLPELVYHFPCIDTSFRLTQRNDTNSTGSSLWLSPQVLSSFLIHTYGKVQQKDSSAARKRVLELGSGTGLLSLLMARLGWDTVATDIPPVLESVLKPNVEAGLYQLVNEGKAEKDQIRVCQLDWTVLPERWHWHPELGFPSAQEHVDADTRNTQTTTEQHFDLILTADTIYEPSLIRSLLFTIAHLYQRQAESKPTILLALERRDPTQVNEAFRLASEDYDLPFKQIPAKRVRKIFDTLGDGAAWSRDDWDGVEIWKL